MEQETPVTTEELEKLRKHYAPSIIEEFAVRYIRSLEAQEALLDAEK